MAKAKHGNGNLENHIYKYLVKNNLPYAWSLGGTEKKRSTSLSRMSSKPQSSPELEKVKKEEKPGGCFIKLNISF